MSPRYLVAVALSVLVAAPLSAQSVKAGIEAWQKADYSGAVAIWRPLAEHGDVDAQFNLGQAYRLGRGVPINLALAKGWFVRAADKGHLDAQTTLGLLLFQNGDLVDGLRWLKQAAEMGEPRALLVYGTALYNGDGVTQDRLLGYAYVSKAAAAGLGPAKDTLSQLDELIAPADRQKALALSRAIPNGSGAAAGTAKPQRVSQAKPPAPKPTEPKPSARKLPAPEPKAQAPKPAAPPTGAKRQLADPARRILTARRGGSAIQPIRRQICPGGTKAHLRRSRNGYATTGGTIRKSRRGAGSLRIDRNGVLPGRGEVISA